MDRSRFASGPGAGSPRAIGVADSDDTRGAIHQAPGGDLGLPPRCSGISIRRFYRDEGGQETAGAPAGRSWSRWSTGARDQALPVSSVAMPRVVRTGTVLVCRRHATAIQDDGLTAHAFPPEVRYRAGGRARYGAAVLIAVLLFSETTVAKLAGHAITPEEVRQVGDGDRIVIANMSARHGVRAPRRSIATTAIARRASCRHARRRDHLRRA